MKLQCPVHHLIPSIPYHLIFFSPLGLLGGISDVCIGCICQGATTCNKTAQCTPDGVCGPLAITKPYWVEGGSNRLDKEPETSNDVTSKYI
jgi:hypothetical protein